MGRVILLRISSPRLHYARSAFVRLCVKSARSVTSGHYEPQDMLMAAIMVATNVAREEARRRGKTYLVASTSQPMPDGERIRRPGKRSDAARR